VNRPDQVSCIGCGAGADYERARNVDGWRQVFDDELELLGWACPVCLAGGDAGVRAAMDAARGTVA